MWEKRSRFAVSKSSNPFFPNSQTKLDVHLHLLLVVRFCKTKSFAAQKLKENFPMAIELIKVRPRPDHFHRDGQAVCERCMSKLASSGSPLYDAVSEYFFVSKQLLLIFAESIFQFAIWLLEQTKEHIYIANEILLIIAKFVLFTSMGIGMAVAALFPAVAGGKSAYEEELDETLQRKKTTRVGEAPGRHRKQSCL